MVLLALSKNTIVPSMWPTAKIFIAVGSHVTQQGAAEEVRHSVAAHTSS